MATERRPVYLVYEALGRKGGNVETDGPEHAERLRAFAANLRDAGCRIDGAGEVAYTPVERTIKRWMRGANSQYIHAALADVWAVFAAPHPCPWPEEE